MEGVAVEKKYKPVHMHIYDPAQSMFKGTKNAKAKCSVVKCNNSENCDLFARGECSWLAAFGWHKCPYGKFEKTTGFTQRARGHHVWMGKMREQYEGVGSLNTHKDMIAFVGDYVFLPYAHMTMNDVIPFLEKGGFMRKESAFLLKEHFTVENIIRMIEYRPQAMMGGEIKSYQTEIVPKFVKHLQEVVPDLYNKVCKTHPRTVQIADEYSYIGRKAYVNTLKKGTVVTKYHDTNKLKTQHWTWDGEYLVSTDTNVSFAIITYVDSEIKLKPQDDAVVVITSDDQVDANTRFAT